MLCFQFDNSSRSLPTVWFIVAILGVACWSGVGQAVRTSHADDQIPHAQDSPPNEPRDPQTAARLMTVPEGFTVEVVASEPQIVNPVAMTIDERGRFWITESVEYPRHSAGVGQDRIKVLEDADGDGTAETSHVFLDGLNIPSGIAVGHGGVWVANAPDLLFVQDTDGDGKADTQEVVITGLGRDDTHELANSLTWGPDGWLYGLNGVFNPCHVRYPPSNPNYAAAGGEAQPGWPFTIAMFRIHPRTREFQLFCEGTSNPWGIAFNENGSAFISACVIDHLWHLVETGYYNRQAGAYPPHTWKIESIVRHKHQKAAYCGITWFDSDAYPEEYRRKLYMGNIHGGCINVDSVAPAGSTYFGSPHDDFLTANDAWFMPVVQKTGPDGSLYVLDWYDRYHCYQDANRDPAGIDRGRGRLYRVRYKATPRSKRFDFGKASDDQLLAQLASPNIYKRETAQRVLQERNSPALAERLTKLVLDDATPDLKRRHGLFVLAGTDLLATPKVTRNKPSESSLLQPTVTALAGSKEAYVRGWAVRMMTNALPTLRRTDNWSEVQTVYSELARSALADPSPEVQLQGLIYVTRLCEQQPSALNFSAALVQLVRTQGADPLLGRIAWKTIYTYLQRHPEQTPEILGAPNFASTGHGPEITSRLLDWLLESEAIAGTNPGQILKNLLTTGGDEIGAVVLRRLAAKTQTRELGGPRLTELQTELRPVLAKRATRPTDPLLLDVALLLTTWGDESGVQATRTILETGTYTDDQRVAAAQALVGAKHASALSGMGPLLQELQADHRDLAKRLLEVLAPLDDPQLATQLLRVYPQLHAELKPVAIELLSQRATWAQALLNAVANKTVNSADINGNQARRIRDFQQPELTELLATHWGQVRDGRSADREQVISAMRGLIRRQPGDPFAGEKVFARVCGQCHKIYGQGAEVGPEITLNGRNDFTQLLSNVFDPSLVIGASYRGYTVATAQGRVVSGLLVEDSPARVVLKVQGGKLEIIPRADVDEFQVSAVSLMPEQLERQIAAQEMVDLFAFLTLDKHPSDPSAKRLAGVGEVVARESTNPDDFANIAAEVAPGFTQIHSGERGVALLQEHAGRTAVLRTHPVSGETPALLAGSFSLPADRPSKLLIDASHDPRGDWQLVVRVNGQPVLTQPVGPDSVNQGWASHSVDLSAHQGQTVSVEVLNQASGWSWEFAYWGRVQIVSE